MKTKKLTWYYFRPEPGEFLCAVCGNRDADRVAHLTLRGKVGLNLPVCGVCGEMDEQTIAQKLSETYGLERGRS